MEGESTVTLEIASFRFETWLYLLVVCFGQVNSPLRISIFLSVKIGIIVPYLPSRAIRGLNGTLFVNKICYWYLRRSSVNVNFSSLILV